MKESDTLLFPTQIERALSITERYFPVETPVMRSTLAQLMNALLAQKANLAIWHLSRLTGDGFPLEFTFTTANDAVRYTLEVEPPHSPPHPRLQQALNLLRQIDPELGAVLQASPTLAELTTIQHGANLDYGAWIGVRHRGEDTQFKIYAEVPTQNQEIALGYVNQFLRRPVFVKDRHISLRMIGWYPDSNAFEFYYRVINLHPWEIIALLGPIGLEGQEKTIFNQMEKAHGRPMHRALPGPVFGFSYAVTPDHPSIPPVFSFYTFSDTLFGTGAQSRRKVLTYFEKLGVTLPCYAEMSQPTVDEDKRNDSHGLFGIAVTTGQSPVAHIGLRPPQGEMADVE